MEQKITPTRRLVQIHYEEIETKKNQETNFYKTILVNDTEVTAGKPESMFIFNNTLQIAPKATSKLVQNRLQSKKVKINPDHDIIFFASIKQTNRNTSGAFLPPLEFEQPKIIFDTSKKQKFDWIPVTVTNQIQETEPVYLINGEQIEQGKSKKILAPSGIVLIEEIKFYYNMRTNQNLSKYGKQLLNYLEQKLPARSSYLQQVGSKVKKRPHLSRTNTTQFLVYRTPDQISPFLNPKNKDKKKNFEKSYYSKLPHELITKIACYYYLHAYHVTIANQLCSNGRVIPSIVKSTYQWPYEKKKEWPKPKTIPQKKREED